MVVATKVCFRRQDGPNARGLSRKVILKTDWSLYRLGTDYASLYQKVAEPHGWTKPVSRNTPKKAGAGVARFMTKMTRRQLCPKRLGLAEWRIAQTPCLCEAAGTLTNAIGRCRSILGNRLRPRAKMGQPCDEDDETKGRKTDREGWHVEPC